MCRPSDTWVNTGFLQSERDAGVPAAEFRGVAPRLVGTELDISESSPIDSELSAGLPCRL